MIIRHRWEHQQKQRYYLVLLGQDLFGQWTITRVWGGINQASGRVTHIACANFEEAVQQIERIAKTRSKRGYIYSNSSGV